MLSRGSHCFYSQQLNLTRTRTRRHPSGGDDGHLLTYKIGWLHTPGNSPHTVCSYRIGSDIAPEQGGVSTEKRSIVSLVEDYVRLLNVSATVSFRLTSGLQKKTFRSCRTTVP